jgi:DNA-binding LytR/AlgR family response regulator
MVRVLVCDDDKDFLEDLYGKVKDILDKKEIRAKVHKFQTMGEISDQMLSSCDIAFLDVDYNNQSYNGMDIARRLRNFRRDAIIIFVTNFIEYAPEGYEVQAFRYILKRNIKTELEPYLSQAFAHLNASRETMKIQVNGECIDLLIDDVLYMEVVQHNVTVYVQRPGVQNGVKSYMIYSSLTDIEQGLTERGFLRIHKSYLVNMRHIVKFQSKAALLDNGTTLRVGEKSYSENKKKYLLWRDNH